MNEALKEKEDLKKEDLEVKETEQKLPQLTTHQAGQLATFRKYLPLLTNLAGRDFKLKYRRSVLGVAWSILNPLLMMLVLTQVFGLLLKIKVENFPVYYIVGSSLWTFFSEATQLSMTSVINSAQLIKKVYIPKYIFPLEKCLFALENFLFSLIAVVLVMLFQRFVPSITTLLFFIPVLYVLVFSIGIGLALSAMTVYFRDVMHLYGIVLTIWMYITPILYPVEVVKDNAFIYAVVSHNPMTYYVTYFRDLLMYNTIPGLKYNLICVGWALLALVIGGLIFHKAQNKFILHL